MKSTVTCKKHDNLGVYNSGEVDIVTTFVVNITLLNMSLCSFSDLVYFLILDNF